MKVCPYRDMKVTSMNKLVEHSMLGLANAHTHEIITTAGESKGSFRPKINGGMGGGSQGGPQMLAETEIPMTSGLKSRY